MTNTFTVSDVFSTSITRLSVLATISIICVVVPVILVGIVAVLIHIGVMKWKKWRKEDNVIPSLLVRYCSVSANCHVNASTIIISFVTSQ